MGTHDRSVLLALAVLGLAGCGTPQRPVTFDANRAIVTVHTSRETARAFIRDGACPTQTQGGPAPAFAPLAIVAGAASALAPVIADFSVKVLQDYLARVQSEQTASYRASGTGVLRGDASAANGPCLIVVRGRFGAAPSDDLVPESGILERRHLTMLGLSDYPTLYMEASIRADTATNAAARTVADARMVSRRSGLRDTPSQPVAEPAHLHLLFRPEALQFARTAAPRPGDGRKAVGMLVLLRTAPLATSATEAQGRDGAVLVLPLDFGRVQEGTAVRATATMAVHPFADQERAVSVPVLTATANVDAFVTEAGDPSRVIELLAATLKDNEATVEKAIADAVKAAIPKPRAP